VFFLFWAIKNLLRLDDILCVSSGTIPLRAACNTTSYYYRLPGLYPSIRDLMGDNSIKEDLLSPLAKSAISVCILNMSRIREILPLKLKHILHPDRVLCPGSKKSCSYMIFLPDLSKQISLYDISDPEMSLFPISYQKLYRWCVKIGLTMNPGLTSNKPKLHAHRYIFARGVSSIVDTQTLTDLMHHRSDTSQLYYLQNKEATDGKIKSWYTRQSKG
jgi:hypothetical protein